MGWVFLKPQILMGDDTAGLNMVLAFSARGSKRFKLSKRLQIPHVQGSYRRINDNAYSLTSVLLPRAKQSNKKSVCACEWGSDWEMQSSKKNGHLLMQ